MLLAAAAALLMAPGARADGTSDLESLLDEDVITTASTRAERASAAPATSVTLTAEDLQTYGLRTLAEAINFLGLGLVTSDPCAHAGDRRAGRIAQQRRRQTRAFAGQRPCEQRST